MFLILFIGLWVGLVSVGCSTAASPTPTVLAEPSLTLAPTDTVVSTPLFDGDRAYEDVRYQVDLGPRFPGTEGHRQVIEWIGESLVSAGWEASVQEGEYHGFPIRNIVAKRTNADPNAEWIILGAHFDTRPHADHDPDPNRRNDPVPGANDGASGVAVLLELARVLPPDADKNVWLVFFDAEDGGGIENREWSMGASYFVEQLEAEATLPDVAVVVDMIGDANLNVYLELNSDMDLSGEIWGIAGDLGYADNIIPTPRHRMLDDHLPFRNAGVPVSLMIDFDYPYWHTVEDTADKVSGQSLQIIGETLSVWLAQK